MDSQSDRMYSQSIDGHNYEVFRYHFPSRLESDIQRLRKWFRLMDSPHTPPAYKRRKGAIEFMEAAVMVAARIDALCRLGIPFLAGSGYLSPKPWAAFGDTDREARLRFRDFGDICRYYDAAVMRGTASAGYFYFRVAPGAVQELADRHNHTSHYVVSVALMLLVDILKNVGPDTPELFDLFTNDVRVGPGGVNLPEWRRLRTRVFGSKAKARDKSYNIHLGQVSDPPVPLTTRTTFEELPCGGDLAAGEKTVVPRTPTYAVPDLDDENDDNTIPIEVDRSFGARVKAKLDKYAYLGISIDVG